ncbi:unnamed protein product [Lampetra fluviatilis]
MGLWNFSHQILALSTCPMPASLGRPVRAASLGACELHYRPGGLAMLVALRCQAASRGDVADGGSIWRSLWRHLRCSCSPARQEEEEVEVDPRLKRRGAAVASEQVTGWQRASTALGSAAADGSEVRAVQPLLAWTVTDSPRHARAVHEALQ